MPGEDRSSWHRWASWGPQRGTSPDPRGIWQGLSSLVTQEPLSVALAGHYSFWEGSLKILLLPLQVNPIPLWHQKNRSGRTLNARSSWGPLPTRQAAQERELGSSRLHSTSVSLESAPLAQLLGQAWSKTVGMAPRFPVSIGDHLVAAAGTCRSQDLF